LVFLKIRNATANDAPAIAAIQVAASQNAYADIVSPDYLKRLTVQTRTSVWTQLITAASGPEQIMVGEEADLLCCYAHFGRSRDADATDTTGELSSLYVHPGSWRRGFGRNLLTASMRRLGDLGFNDATLWVLAANSQARRFYERLGWDIDGTEKGPDNNVIKIRYRCQLPTGCVDLQSIR
jgi:ribosomal protein S18 acetylase RimI-like enzyme